MNQAGARTERRWFNFTPRRLLWAGESGKNITDCRRIQRMADHWTRRYQAMPLRSAWRYWPP
jgi:hypothetical protein